MDHKLLMGSQIKTKVTMCATKWDIIAANDNGKDRCPISKEKYEKERYPMMRRDEKVPHGKFCAL